jgi:hypothetical protein
MEDASEVDALRPDSHLSQSRRYQYLGVWSEIRMNQEIDKEKPTIEGGSWQLN